MLRKSNGKKKNRNGSKSFLRIETRNEVLKIQASEETVAKQ